MITTIMTGMAMTITATNKIITDMMDMIMMAMTTMITVIGTSTQVMTMEMMNIQIMWK